MDETLRTLFDPTGPIAYFVWTNIIYCSELFFAIWLMFVWPAGVLTRWLCSPKVKRS